MEWNWELIEGVVYSLEVEGGARSVIGKEYKQSLRLPLSMTLRANTRISYLLLDKQMGERRQQSCEYLVVHRVLHCFSLLFIYSL